MTNFDENNLSSTEVKHLIQTLKCPTHNFNIADLRQKITTNLATIDSTGKVIGIVDNIEYKLYLFTSNSNGVKPRGSIHLRFANSNQILARVDIGGYHTNPVGIEPYRISGTHIHIYNDHFKKRDKIAYPVDGENFPIVTTIIAALDDFIKFMHINY